MSRISPLLCIVTATLVISACGKSRPTVSDAWVRSAPGGVAVSAAYMKIEGKDTLASVSAPQALVSVAELHKTTATPIMGEQMMGMGPAGEVPFDGSLKLSPGGYHIMLMGLKQELTPGQKLPITLQFKEAGKVIVDATVRGNE